VIYCHQRASQLAVLDLVSGSFTTLVGSDDHHNGQDGQDVDLDFSCRSPRVLPGSSSQQVVFLSRESVGPHFCAARLRVVDRASGQIHTIVDIVDSPASGLFPGLYISCLPKQCILGQEHLLCTTQWGVNASLVIVPLNLSSSSTATATPIRMCVPKGFDPSCTSAQLLDINEGQVLATFSSPNRLSYHNHNHHHFS
jgi:hypothetical protein